MENFYRKLQKHYPLSDADIMLLLERMEEVSFRKRDLIVREGERNNSLYLLKNGIWRGYYYKDGNDTTIWFVGEGEAAFSSWGLIDNTASRINIEALSDSTAYVIGREALETLYGTSAALANLGRRLIEQQFLGIENWLIDGGAPTARERYIRLTEEHPELLRDVPLKHIASYLWITPQSLSRIRASLQLGRE